MKAVIFDMFETLVTLYSAPLYFGRQIAEDLGVTPEAFYPHWHASEEIRSKGQMNFEEAILQIGEKITYAYPERIPEVVKKRYAFKKECFRHVEERILVMLQELKAAGAKIGLISNCFEEEQIAIRGSVLVPYFDVMILSCEVGMQKPEKAIFHRCTELLGVAPEDCLYVGDGGSMELETAKSLGMHPLQAGWYLGTRTCGERNEAFSLAEEPADVVKTYVKLK